MEILKRKENESDFEYGLRLISEKVEKTIDVDWQDIVEILDLNVHRDTLRKSAAVGEYCGYKVAQYYKDKIKELLVKQNNDNEKFKELIKEYEDKRLDFEKEKVKYQDQKREYKNFMKADARFDHLIEEMKKGIEKLNDKYPLLIEDECKNNDIQKTSKNEAVLILSDLHIGMEVKNKFNKYNKQIAKKRLNELKRKVLTYCKRHNVKNLHIELLGDLINGYIHLSTRVFNEEDVVSQIISCSELLCRFICSLAQKLSSVKVYCTIGNHGRCMPSIKDSIDIENFERLIGWYCKGRIKSKKVQFIDNKEDDEIIVFKVLNETIFAVHGHKDKISSIIDNLTTMLKIFPDEVHCGHYHSHATLESNNTELIVNGSFCGTDDYAKSIRKSNKPSQTLIIYNEDGQECLYKIKLKS